MSADGQSDAVAISDASAIVVGAASSELESLPHAAEHKKRSKC